jgi:hypothetical protein
VKIERAKHFLILAVPGLRQIGGTYHHPYPTVPDEQYDFRMKDSSGRSYRKDVPTRTFTAICMHPVHQDECPRDGQFFLALDEIRRPIFPWIGFQAKESRKAVFLEKIGCKGKGGGNASYRLAGSLRRDP